MTETHSTASIRHTPGPWRVDLVDSHWLWATDERGDWPLAFFACGTRPDQTDVRSADEIVANARLAAAAPDLLETLRMVRDSLRGISTIEQLQAGYEVGWCNAAIQKAEGGQ